ncbi:hypothetical protein GOODEAATRI_002365 [Goodea atripinnis]|uniref:Uncharacterized protein n=1 Tax=Goodea atripinnis TaxID=208336 RepID=A0ABV0PUN1_9TELE
MLRLVPPLLPRSFLWDYRRLKDELLPRNSLTGTQTGDCGEDEGRTRKLPERKLGCSQLNEITQEVPASLLLSDARVEAKLARHHQSCSTFSLAPSNGQTSSCDTQQ